MIDEVFDCSDMIPQGASKSSMNIGPDVRLAASLRLAAEVEIEKGHR
jgi:hypothetical protein